VEYWSVCTGVVSQGVIELQQWQQLVWLGYKLEEEEEEEGYTAAALVVVERRGARLLLVQ
jgi:hypothetical protein